MEDILANVFSQDRAGWPKARVLYRLAQQAEGPIVEVGCGRGIGAVALALGAQAGNGVPVYAIDPFTEVRGWANERYGPDWRAVWFEHVRDAGVLEHVQSVMLPVQDLVWPYPAALTFWDIGRKLEGEVATWLDRWYREAVSMGGLIAINETGENNLGVDAWLKWHPGLELLALDFYIRIVRKDG